MILEEKDGLLTMCYDFEEKTLSFIIHNPEDDSETQINIGRTAANKLMQMLNIISKY